MAHSKAKLKSNRDKASPLFQTILWSLPSATKLWKTSVMIKHTKTCALFVNQIDDLIIITSQHSRNSKHCKLIKLWNTASSAIMRVFLTQTFVYAYWLLHNFSSHSETQVWMTGHILFWNDPIFIMQFSIRQGHTRTKLSHYSRTDRNPVLLSTKSWNILNWHTSF